MLPESRADHRQRSGSLLMATHLERQAKADECAAAITRVLENYAEWVGPATCPDHGDNIDECGEGCDVEPVTALVVAHSTTAEYVMPQKFDDFYVAYVYPQTQPVSSTVGLAAMSVAKWANR